MRLKKYLDQLEDLNGKKVIITGGTSGIGLSIVKHLLYKHAHVVVMARNLNKANEIKEKLLETFPNNEIEIIEYDQSNDQSIIEASKVIASQHLDFYALILNAGVFQSKNKSTCVDDIALTIKTNFVGLNNLLDNLLSHLNGQHRIVFQGSVAAGFHIKKIQSLKDKNISAWQQYCISKAGVESTYFHYYKNSPKNLAFYLVEPGLTNTEIIRDFPTPIKQMGHVFLKVVSHSSDKAALTALLALQSNISNGSFIVPRGIFTFMGYPKIKSFPRKRERPELYNLLVKL